VLGAVQARPAGSTLVVARCFLIGVPPLPRTAFVKLPDMGRPCAVGGGSAGWS